MGGREKLNVGELRITGHDTKVGTPTVKVLVRDAAGNVALSTGATKPTDADAGYSIGAIFMKTDGAVYFNAGTVTSCNFDVQGTIGAGGVTSAMLATGAVVAAAIGAGAVVAAGLGASAVVAAKIKLSARAVTVASGATSGNSATGSTYIAATIIGVYPTADASTNTAGSHIKSVTTASTGKFHVLMSAAVNHAAVFNVVVVAAA